ncbi:hypothetical protein CDL12_26814 [Handroanthus impetiginosus]|uniref:Uncharacterized protein n=1 Tax=Handroanthus impetiginosus TaxID=429701 RepID=A0A2G9G6X5_9LAMI|nr:hypothetical protein CDL12_26814 [Handroanthus impetiginosus]
MLKVGFYPALLWFCDCSILIKLARGLLHVESWAVACFILVLRLFENRCYSKYTNMECDGEIKNYYSTVNRKPRVMSIIVSCR